MYLINYFSIFFTQAWKSMLKAISISFKGNFTGRLLDVIEDWRGLVKKSSYFFVSLIGTDYMKISVLFQ